MQNDYENRRHEFDHLEEDGISGALQVGLALYLEQRLGLSLFPLR